MNILDSALALAALGLPVFPCASNKRPCCEGGHTAATTDPATVARLFADPRAVLIGVPTGPVSGFDVLDIDPKSGGGEWLAANESSMPATRRHHTRSSGVHFLFQHTAGLRNSASKIAPGVDIRADGGYVIWWPAHGCHAEGDAWATCPDFVLVAALRARARGASAPAPADLAPPSAADLVALLRAMPNPADTTRDEYVSLNLAVQGCCRALEHLDRATAEDIEDIRDAAAGWCARWDSDRAADVETERERWESDWGVRTNDVSGWRHVLALADRVGLDTSPMQHAAAVAEFGVLPTESQESDTAPLLMPRDSPASTSAPIGDPAWFDKLLRKKDEPLPNLANALYALRRAPEWQGVLARDIFASVTTLYRRPPWHSGQFAARPVADSDFARTAEWLQNHGLNVPLDTTRHAFETIAEEHQIHPVREYLDTLHHDGIPRADTLLPDYFGAADVPLNRAIGAKMLIGAVARVCDPGCKLDTMPVFEGRQGLLKSSALAVIFGKAWTSDRMPDLSNKDAMVHLSGLWLQEFAELASLNRSESNHVKAFMSSAVDRFRPPYGRKDIVQPRQCVFVGTVNRSGTGYLKDETGARRFWPVACGIGWPDSRCIDIAALGAVRDQLWAEAVVRFRAGEPWWLHTFDLENAQRDATGARYDADEWTDKVLNIVAGKPFCRTADILNAMGKPTRDHTRADSMRVAGILTVAGWRPKTQTIDGRAVRTYTPPPGAAIFDRPEQTLHDLVGT